MREIPQVYLTGNTAGLTHAYGPSYTFVGGPNVTLSGSNGSLVISGAAGGTGGGTGGLVALVAGTQTATSGTLVLVNSNGLAWGLSGSSQITGSYTVPILTAYQFLNSNGVSWGTTGSTVTATVKTDYLTTQSVQPQSAFLLSALNGLVWGTNGSTITGSYTVPTQSNAALSAANGSFTFQTAAFANSNGVSFSTGTQGIFATIATNYLTTARASTDAIGLNTAQTNVTWTANSAGISLNAGGYAGTVTGATKCSVTANTTGVSVNVPKGWTFLGTATGATTTVGPVIWAGTFKQLMIIYWIQGYNGGTPVGRIQLGAAAISTTALNNSFSISEGVTAPSTGAGATAIPGCPLAVTLSAIGRGGTIMVDGVSGGVKSLEIHGRNVTPSVASAPTLFRGASFFSDLGTNLPIQRAQLTVYDTLTATAPSAQTFTAGTYLSVWGRNTD